MLTNSIEYPLGLLFLFDQPIHKYISMKHICDHIYLSSLDDALNLRLIKFNNIKTVIRLADENHYDITSPYDESIQYCYISIDDTHAGKYKLLTACREAYDIIINTKGNVLVHCNMGRSRSPSVIIYYLMRQYKYFYKEAIDLIRKIKSDVAPNLGFVQVLHGPI